MEPTRKTTKRRRGAAAIVLAFIVGCAIWFVAADREEGPLDEAARESLGGTYARLSLGHVYYELTGPREGPVVVLVHGATIPSWDWDYQVPALVEEGYRVLRYDKYGRGLSARPKVNYDRALYREQLVQLLEHLEINRPVHLVGHSMGGATAVGFTVKNSRAVRSLSLVAPVVDSVESRAPFVISNIPIFGRFLVRTVMIDVIEGRARSLWSSAGPKAEYYGELFEMQTTYDGFEDSLISMFKGDAVGDYREEYEGLAQLGLPTMLVWGTEDPDISREKVDWVQQTIPDMTCRILDGAGHSPNVDAREVFNPILLDFLSKN